MARLSKPHLLLGLLLALCLPCRAMASLSQQPPVQAAVQARGHLLCGVNTGLAGFSAADAEGRWHGLDVDICRAVAAAVLGDGERVRFVPLNARERFERLRDGAIDLLSRNTTITLERDAALGLQMTAISYYDGQAFMVRLDSRIRSARQLQRRKVCLQNGSSSVRNVQAYARRHRLALVPLLFDRLDQVVQAYFDGQCDALANEVSQMASIRATHAANPADHLILPEQIAKGPMGPLVRRGDADWASLVRWVVYGLIEAEELGITQHNLDAHRASADPAVRRIVGTGEDIGKPLGLDREWLARAIRTTGNYGEIFERHLGPRSPLALPRGLNHLWNRGGLHYAPPIQ